MRQLLDVLARNLQRLCEMPDFDAFLSHGTQREQVEALLAMTRGVCSLEAPGGVCLAFLAKLPPLLPPLLHRLRLDENLRLVVLHLLDDAATTLGFLSQETNLAFGAALLACFAEVGRLAPGEGSRLRRQSDDAVKMLSLCFRALLHACESSPCSDCVAWEACVVETLLRGLQTLRESLTFYPLLMKTVFDAALLVCRSCVRGFDCLAPMAAADFFAFMLLALDRFEWASEAGVTRSCAVKSMECLYLLLSHCVEVRDGRIGYAATSDRGVMALLANEPGGTVGEDSSTGQIDNLFMGVFAHIFSPKSDVVSKDGMNISASNVILLIMVLRRDSIAQFLRETYTAALQQYPSLLDPILSDVYVQNYEDREVRWRFNEVLYSFYTSVKTMTDQKVL